MFKKACIPVFMLVLASCGPALEPLPDIESVVQRIDEGDMQALELLPRYFSSPVEGEAYRALEVVIKAGRGAVPHLVLALGSNDEKSAEFAAGALGNIGDPRAVDPLIGALENPDLPKYVVVWALGELKDDRAVEPLFALLGDENLEVRKYATRALIKYGKKIVPRAVTALEGADPRVRHYAVRIIGQLGGPEDAGKIIDHYRVVEPEVALWALGRLGNTGAFSLIAGEAGHSDWQVRLEAIKALGYLEDKRAVPVLESALEDGEWIIREWAARSLENVTGQRQRYRDKNGDLVVPYNLYH